MYTAHTPDNSFLGFVVEKHNVSHTVPSHYANKSLVYGKELYMWKNKKDYLQVIAKYFDVYATIGTTQNKGEVLDWSVVPSFVHNQGILGGPQLQQLLQVSMILQRTRQHVKSGGLSVHEVVQGLIQGGRRGANAPPRISAAPPSI